MKQGTPKVESLSPDDMSPKNKFFLREEKI